MKRPHSVQTVTVKLPYKARCVLAAMVFILLASSSSLFPWSRFLWIPLDDVSPSRSDRVLINDSTDNGFTDDSTSLITGPQDETVDPLVADWPEWGLRESPRMLAVKGQDWNTPERSSSWRIWRSIDGGRLESTIFEDFGPPSIPRRLGGGGLIFPETDPEIPAAGLGPPSRSTELPLGAPKRKTAAHGHPQAASSTRSADTRMGAEQQEAPGKQGYRSMKSMGHPVAAMKAPKRWPLRQRPAKYPRFRPILLSRLIGKNAVRPPKGKLKPPSFSHLHGRIPERNGNGELVRRNIETPEAVENIAPPDFPLTHETDGNDKDFHWHPKDPANLVAYYHSGSDWGRAGAAGWAWLKRAGQRWWISAQSENSVTTGGEIALVRHSQRWWWQANGVWFLLHQGQPWGYRYFPDWQAEGLMHPGSGTKMIYSSDGARIALVTPGQGAVVFDAFDGLVLARLSEEQIPQRPKPRAPSGLSLPP